MRTNLLMVDSLKKFTNTIFCFCKQCFGDYDYTLKYFTINSRYYFEN